MTRNYLFSSRDFDKLSEEIRHAAFQNVSKLTKHDFERNTIDDISTTIFEIFSIKNLILNEEEVSQKTPKDIYIERQLDYLNYQIEKIQGTRFHFVLPFEGDSRLLKVRPSTFSLQFPFGDVENNTINFKYEVEASSDKTLVVSQFKINLQILKGWVVNVNNDANQFNTNLKTFIYNEVTSRNQKINDDLDSANSFGIPIK